MTEHYDVVVVGGGIHGVGVAQAAACHGYSVLLLEKTALAAGTSSRSSKLIHGGLRYLESRDFRLVRESLHERAILLEIAPELVHLSKFYIPVYAGTTRRPLLLRAGLTLYALLGGLDQAGRFRSVPRRQWDAFDGLRQDGLQAVFQYHDAQTNDVQLTRAVMHSAIGHGTELKCPAEFLEAHVEGRHCEIAYRQGDIEQHCRAAVLVNAGGPWVNTVNARIRPAPPAAAIDLVQGSHLVLEGSLGACYYMEAPRDRRAIFLLPWGEHSLLGTTEHRYTGDPADVTVLPQEQAYLLEVLAHYFPQRAPRVVEAFAGVRVLPAADGSAFTRSRETQLLVDDTRAPRVLSIIGGKLTGYRATAEQVMRRLRGSLPAAQRRADTATVPLRPVS